MTRTGRRPGSQPTRQAIIEVARQRFATSGYEATSLRSIAGDAGVDPALLIHYFATKEGLFAAATGLPPEISELSSTLITAVSAGQLDRDEALEEFVRAYLVIIDGDQSRNAVLAIVRSAVSHEQAATTLREFFTRTVLRFVEALNPGEGARLRASLVAAQLVGIAMLRHVVRIEPLARADREQIVSLVLPAIRTYIHPS